MTASRRPLRSALLLLFALAAACTEREAGTAAEEPQYGGTVVVANVSDLHDMNPLVAGEKYSQEVLRNVLFLPLLRHSPDFAYEPVLAERWELLGDTGVIVHLRRDVRWHDGVPTTAHDVAFTFNAARDPATGYSNAEYFAQWTDVEVQDSFTVRFGFRPHMDPLGGLVFLPIVPAHLLSGIPAAEIRTAGFNRAPVGNGPFRFVEYRANDRWVFEANPEFPEGLGGRPYIDRLVWRPVPDQTAMVTELQTARADIVLTPSAEQYARLRDAAGLRGIHRGGSSFASAIWNVRVPPLDDPRVRLALGLAIDRPKIIHTVRAGFGDPAAGPIGPTHWAYDPAVTPLPHSPDSAVALLRSAGIEDRNGDGTLELPDGRPFRIELKFPAQSTVNRDMAELIRHDLAQIGVRLDTRPTEWATMQQDFLSPQRNFQVILLGWEYEYRPNLRENFHSAAIGAPYQFSSYSNPRVDSLIDRTGTARTLDEARPLYGEIQRILRDEQPWSFLYFFPDMVLLRDRVQGVEMDRRGVLVNVARWWVTDPRPAAPGDSADHSPSPDPAPGQ